MTIAKAPPALGQAQPLPSTQPAGFRLERYEPTAAGSPLLLVERPWYAPERQLAVALTLGYAHLPLRFFSGERALPAVVEHALGGSLDIAGSPWTWLQLRGSLPVTLLERGTTDSTAAVAPMDSATMGDPRLGAMAALYRRPDAAPFSVHLGIDVWFPVGAAASHQGDLSVRALPRAVLAGVLPRGLRWTFEAAFLGRGDNHLGEGSRQIVAGSEIQLAAALGYATPHECLQLALEGRFAARVTQTAATSGDMLRGQLLLSTQVQAGPWVQIGAAVGSDFATPGTPDVRALLRVGVSLPHPSRSTDAATSESAPQPAVAPALLSGPQTVAPPSPAAGPPAGDADGDGIPDEVDRCPYEPEDKNGFRDDDGCPESPLAIQAARFMGGSSPAPGRPSEPARSVAQAASATPTQGEPSAPPSPSTLPAATTPPASAKEVPVTAPAASAKEDSDRDGVPDDEDRCPLSAEDHDGFEDDDGCPDLDNDGDDIPDTQDRCPLEAETLNGVDDEDGCPDVANLPAPQASVSARGDRIEVNQQVQFELRRLSIAAGSLPLLREVARILRAHPSVKIEVQGHTDGVGDAERNLALSQGRAEAVRAFLIKDGVAAAQLRARGYGATHPRASNDTPDGRAKNRRVEFVIQGGGQ
ncbi:MAG TPA: OmpA family protein [Pseudomonadota bacterium]|nr:OmpA family protein [Pseudomonadota bacterium]